MAGKQSTPKWDPKPSDVVAALAEFRGIIIKSAQRIVATMRLESFESADLVQVGYKTVCEKLPFMDMEFSPARRRTWMARHIQGAMRHEVGDTDAIIRFPRNRKGGPQTTTGNGSVDSTLINAATVDHIVETTDLDALIDAVHRAELTNKELRALFCRYVLRSQRTSDYEHTKTGLATIKAYVEQHAN